MRRRQRLRTRHRVHPQGGLRGNRAPEARPIVRMAAQDTAALVVQARGEAGVSSREQAFRLGGAARRGERSESFASSSCAFEATALACATREPPQQRSGTPRVARAPCRWLHRSAPRQLDRQIQPLERWNSGFGLDRHSERTCRDWSARRHVRRVVRSVLRRLIRRRRLWISAVVARERPLPPTIAVPIARSR